MQGWEGSLRERVHIFMVKTCIVVQQKPTQHCKTIKIIMTNTFPHSFEYGISSWVIIPSVSPCSDDKI